MDKLILYLSVILVLLIIFAITLRLNPKIKQKQEKKVEKIKLENNLKHPREALIKLNLLSKKFFKEYLHEHAELTFKEIAENLKKKRRFEYIDFCDKMDLALYSGREIKPQEVKELIEEFISLTKKAEIEKSLESDIKNSKAKS